MKTKDARKGGFLVGKPHSEGGIKGINVDTGEPIEVEGGEAIITKPAVESEQTYEFEGKEMKPREILSQINHDHGGVRFDTGGIVKNMFSKGGEVQGLSEDEQWNTHAQKDDVNYMAYEEAIKGLEIEETQLTVARGMVDITDRQRMANIERKLARVIEQKAQLKLRSMGTLQLLDKLAEMFDVERLDAETPTEQSISGVPSQLSPKRYRQVRTKDFMDWFGDWITAYFLKDYNNVSKVINSETNEPLVLFHGSDADFTEWKFDRFPVAYFGDNRSYSEWFQKARMTDGYLYEVFVSMKNPIDARQFGVDIVQFGDIMELLEDVYGIERYIAQPALREYKSDPKAMDAIYSTPMKMWQFVRNNPAFLKYLKDNTLYDGILMYEDNPSDLINGEPNVTGSFVVLYTNQIKWANARYFNPVIKDNRFAFGGML